MAAIIVRDGRFLLVEEQTTDGVRLNQPAGHLDPGESLLAAAARETLEETAFDFTPRQLIGVYLWCTETPPLDNAVTYLRFAFCGDLGAYDPGRMLDSGILRTLWLTRDEIAARGNEHRSPLVQRCVDDYLTSIDRAKAIAHPTVANQWQSRYRHITRHAPHHIPAMNSRPDRHPNLGRSSSPSACLSDCKHSSSMFFSDHSCGP